MDVPEELNETVLPQKVVAPLTRAAIFLVVCIRQDPDAYAFLCSFCAGLSGSSAPLSFGTLRRAFPASLDSGRVPGTNSFDRHGPRTAPVSRDSVRRPPRCLYPGDILFHIRAKRMDLCFELATQIMDSIGDAVSIEDEVHGFRYFDDRDVIGFVDGTENPRGDSLVRLQSLATRTRPLRGQLCHRAKVPARHEGMERSFH